ncbi:MAG: Adaptive-response sensory-kinase SasA [Bryobacteraceae bacterium]|nr:Adaptive-response sensory-kinase SasA [Bryobacteraceae bacterium]
MPPLTAFPVFMAFLGMGLCLFLGIVMFPQRNIRPAGMPAWILVISFGAWHAATLISGLYREAAGRELEYAGLWRAAGAAGLVSGMVAGFRLLWLGLRRRLRLFVFGFGVSVLLAAAFHHSSFFTTGPPFMLAWFIFWDNVFGLLLAVRSVFSLILGISVALYLLLARQLGRIFEQRFGEGGVLLELALLFWAGILWLPVYAAISNFLSRRAAFYTDFARTVIPGAGLILDLKRRMEFLASQLRERFRLRSVLLVFGPECVSAGAPGVLAGPDRQELERYAEDHPADKVYEPRMEDSPAREVMRGLGCQYMYVLREDNQLRGLLLLDATPLAFLDENEEVLQGLAPQIAQSLQSCRLVEEKVGLERELARQENLASLGKAAATIAHEVKNPLSAIKTIAQVMREDPLLLERYGEDLSFIITEVNRLDESVRQLLGFSRPAPSMEETVDMSAEVESAAAALARQANPMGVAINAAIAPGIAVENANRELIRQIVLNLLLNAIQATPAGKAVSVTLEHPALLRVADQGPGIDRALRERVFEPFFTTKVKGTGLGLAIVRRNVKLLGGAVELNCPEGGGTVITVRLKPGRVS